MKEKLIYDAPEVETVEIQMETTILNLSGGEGGATGTRMANDTDTFDEWDK